MSIDGWLLIAAVLLLLGVVASTASSRLGVPSLLLFLGVGMLAGSDGPGGIAHRRPRRLVPGRRAQGEQAQQEATQPLRPGARRPPLTARMVTQPPAHLPQSQHLDEAQAVVDEKALRSDGAGMGRKVPG